MTADSQLAINQEKKSSNIRRRQADRSALSDIRMIDAAIHLLSERGVDGVTLVAVGERAGYSRGLVTRRYGSKAGLLARVLEHLNATSAEKIKAAEGECVGIDMIKRLFTQLFHSMQHEPDAVRARHLLWFHSLEPTTEFHATLDKLHRVQRRQLERWLREGQAAGNVRADLNVARVAEQILALSAGISYQWLVTPGMPISATASSIGQTVESWLKPPIIA